MEEHVDQDSASGSEGTPPTVDDRPALLLANEEVPRRGYDGCSRGCSRAVHCSLTLPFLLIIGLVIFSVATFYANQDRVGGCVLFGTIKKVDSSGLEGDFEHGTNAVCLTVTGVEMALCAFAILFAIVLVVKAFRHSRMLTPFIFLELFLLFLVTVVSVGISSTMNIGINYTCGSMNDSPDPDFAKCGRIEVSSDYKDNKHPVWDTLLQESLIASWICTLIYLALLLIWVLLSLFTCCAIQSREKRKPKDRARQINAEEGMPIMQEPNVVYGAT